MSSMKYKDKHVKLTITLQEMDDSMPQKKRRSVKWKTLGDDNV